MKKEQIEQLKELRSKREGGSPDAAWLASTRETLLLQIKNTVNETESQKTGAKAFAEFARLFQPVNMTKAIATPLAVVLLMLGTWTGSSALVSAARSTLPGDTLYNVKLLSEKASVTFARGNEKTERRLEMAGRRLDEVVTLAAGSDFMKEEKIGALSAMFGEQMSLVREDLNELDASDTEGTILLALNVDAKAGEYQKVFKDKSFVSRPAMRLALLSLDQVSVKALELLVEHQSSNIAALPEAQLSANVAKSIETFASRVAQTEADLGGDASILDSRIELTAKAKTVVDEAKELFSQGDFKAAVRKVMEGTELVAEAETTEGTDVVTEPVEVEEEPVDEVNGETGTIEPTEEEVDGEPVSEVDSNFSTSSNNN